MSNQESISKFWFLVIPLSFLVFVLGFLIILIPSSNAVSLTNSNNNYLGPSNFVYGQQQQEEENKENQINSSITTS
jgi:hypothetical protein